MRSLKTSNRSRLGYLRKPYYLADQLAFLLPFTKVNLTSENSTVDEQQIDDEDESKITPSTNSFNSKYEVHSPSPSVHITMDDSMNSTFEENDASKKKKKDPICLADESTSTQLIEIRKPMQDEGNEDLLFFQSLLPDMQKLDSRRKRRFKEKVLSMLNDNLDEAENEINSYSWGSSP